MMVAGEIFDGVLFDLDGNFSIVDHGQIVDLADGLNIHADRSTARRGFIFMKILKRFAQRFAASTAVEKKFQLRRFRFQDGISQYRDHCDSISRSLSRRIRICAIKITKNILTQICGRIYSKNRELMQFGNLRKLYEYKSRYEL